jgi:glycosyltransferase involved in cell wall biosynthesis
MKIVFLPISCCPFHGKTLEERPLGGIETAVIRLAEALKAAGHEVYVVTQIESPPPSGPLYLSLKKALEIQGIDILIVIRGLLGLIPPFNCKQRYFWTGDSYDNAHTFGLGDPRIIKRLDGLLAVSDWHAETLCRASGFPKAKTYVLRNGVYLEDFAGEEKRQRKRLIYSSNPCRGLIHLEEIYLEIKRRHADAELAVFSSDAIYGAHWPPLQQSKEEDLFARLRSLPSCTVVGSIKQNLLAREFMKSAILAYPSHFEESSCITAMEAQSGGCVPVTTALAALPEAVQDAGILIEGKAGTKEYRDQFVEACDRLLSDDALFQSYSRRGLERSKGFDWPHRATELITYLQARLP